MKLFFNPMHDIFYSIFCYGPVRKAIDSRKIAELRAPSLELKRWKRGPLVHAIL
jgi:hypothetical protein